MKISRAGIMEMTITNPHTVAEIVEKSEATSSGKMFHLRAQIICNPSLKHMLFRILKNSRLLSP